MKTNTAATRPPIFTAQGGPAKHINPEQQLRRTLMACMLWESNFYESGKTIAERVAELVPQLKFPQVAEIAIEAREKQKLRHAPLLLVREALRHFHGREVGDLVKRVVQRPDEAGELLSLYWRDDPAGKRSPIAAQLKLGLARAIQKFDGYQLAKWDREAAISLRDIVFLTHAKPRDDQVARLFAKMVNKSFIPSEIAGQYGLDPKDVGLPAASTWEQRLSAGEDKRTVFEGMIRERKLGALALLRNLRGMTEAGVPDEVIREGILTMKTERVLPFRFIAAAKHAPRLEPELEQAMLRCLGDSPRMLGPTVLLVDVSGSMTEPLSRPAKPGGKGASEMRRAEAATGLAILTREVCPDVRVLTFSNAVVEVPPRRGFALRDVIEMSQMHGGTALGAAIHFVNTHVPCQRLIVFTDEQTQDRVPDPVAPLAYVVNVSTEKNGVGYGKWTHVDGFSEAIIDYIIAREAEASKDEAPAAA